MSKLLSQARQQLHENAKAQMREGRYKEAQEELLQGLQKFGPHLGLLSDIAMCNYICEQFQDLGRTLDEIYLQLERAKNLVGADSLARTYILVGKMEEERARVSKALELYRLAIELPNVSAPTLRKARAQRLRLQSVLGIPQKDEDLLACFSQYAPGTSLQAEIEHALILHEAVTISPKAAWLRWKATQTQQVHPLDTNLFYFDLLEQALENHDDDLLQRTDFLQHAPRPRDKFEMHLIRLATTHESLSYTQYYELSKGIMPFSFFRVLALYLQKNRVQDIGWTQLSSLISSLPPNEVAEIWKKWAHLLKSNSDKFFLDSDRISNGNQSANVSSKSFDMALFKLVAGRKGQIDIEEALHILYDAEFTEENWSKLRVAVYRVNRKYAGLFCRSKSFWITKNALIVEVDIQSIAT